MRSLLALLLCLGCACAAERYVGREVGALSQLNHGVRGRVFAVDARTLYLQGFHYDGEGPAAYFYVGTTGAPSAAGTRLRDERGGAGPLRKYRGEGVALALPDSLTLKDVKWFAVWCDEYSVNFGDVRIPRDLEVPKPAKVGALRGVHGVSSDAVVVVDAQTLLVPNFSYDGEAPDAKFWVGRSSKPSPAGVRIPDENGKEAPLRKYDRKTIVLTLPGELTVFDIGHFGVWCEAFTVDFGHVTLPKDQLANVPPSLKMLGVSPQSRNKALSKSSSASATTRKPIARVDATTYRPPRLGAGPLAALLDQPVDHSAHLHRRADDYQSPQQQLVDTQKLEPTEYEQLKEQERRNQQQLELLQQQLFYQRNQNLLLEQRAYQQRLFEQQRYEEELARQRNPERFQLVPYQGEQFSQNPAFQNAQRRISQPEFYRPDEQSVRFHTIVDPIQRSIDLDLNAASAQ